MIKTCTNGSSEFMTNISMSLVNMLYNFQLMRIAGENGIAAYGVIMYVSFIFCAMFIGYSVGCAPLIGYNYGAENYPELKNLFHKSLKLVGCAGVAWLSWQTFCLHRWPPFLSDMMMPYLHSRYMDSAFIHWPFC